LGCCVRGELVTLARDDDDDERAERVFGGCGVFVFVLGKVVFVLWMSLFA